QRRLIGERDDMRAELNKRSKDVGRLHREGRKDEAAARQEENRVLGDRITELAEHATALGTQIHDLLLAVPNEPHPDAPDGRDDSDNPQLRRPGYDPDAYGAHQRIPHWELGERYGILDNERAVKVSGAMFTTQRKGGRPWRGHCCSTA